MCATCGYLVAAVCHITASHNRVSAEGWVYCEGDTPNFTYLNMLVSVLVRCLCLLPMTLRVSTSHISKLHILLLLSYDWFFPQKGCPLGYTGYRCQNPPGNGQICHRSAVSSTVCYCHCVDLYKAAHPSTPSWCHTYMQAPLSLSLCLISLFVPIMSNTRRCRGCWGSASSTRCASVQPAADSC
jgi:hypothetical protein